MSAVYFVEPGSVEIIRIPEILRLVETDEGILVNLTTTDLAWKVGVVTKNKRDEEWEFAKTILTAMMDDLTNFHVEQDITWTKGATTRQTRNGENLEATTWTRTVGAPAGRGRWATCAIPAEPPP